jgi:hypothetical protein
MGSVWSLRARRRSWRRSRSTALVSTTTKSSRERDIAVALGLVDWWKTTARPRHHWLRGVENIVQNVWTAGGKPAASRSSTRFPQDFRGELWKTPETRATIGASLWIILWKTAPAVLVGLRPRHRLPRPQQGPILLRRRRAHYAATELVAGSRRSNVSSPWLRSHRRQWPHRRVLAPRSSGAEAPQTAKLPGPRTAWTTSPSGAAVNRKPALIG